MADNQDEKTELEKMADDQNKETELGKMFDEEDKETEEEGHVLKEKQFKSNSEQDKKDRRVKLRLKEITSAHLEYFTEFWEEINWNNYLYGAKEMDFFQLPVVNAFLSEWKDEDCFDEVIVFEKCRMCLKIIDTVNFAISVHVCASEEQQNLWKEAIVNLQETVIQKMDYLSYMLLKNGEKYKNPQTENVEYGRKEKGGLITLCLWANLYAAVRKQGMSKIGFGFKLPMDIVQENCVVRILHLPFNQIFLQKSILEDAIKDRNGIDICISEVKELPEDANEIMKPTKKASEITEDDMETDIFTQVEQDSPNGESKNGNQSEVEEILSTENGNEAKRRSCISEEAFQMLTKQSLSDTNFIPFNPSLLPPLVEPDMHIVDPDEYFIVGGIFHFDLYTMPELNVRVNNITYIHREKPRLRRIRYKRKIVPPRIFDGDLPYIVTAYEKKRFQYELENAIFVELQLPKNVMYLSTPEPARLFLEEGGYSRDCIFCADYEKNSRQISFKTNQFGTFGMLQKKYQNLPYKKWMLEAGEEAVVLSLSGSKLEIDIQVTNHGYTVKRLNPDDGLTLAEINSTWVAADLLIQKLLAVGINIVLGKNAEKFADITKKNNSLEDDVYDCVALLCPTNNFTSVSKCASIEDEIVLEYFTGKNGRTKKVLIRNIGVIDYEVELKRIERVEAALKRIEELEVIIAIVENSGSGTEAETIKMEATEEATKLAIISQETKEEPVFRDLYDYILDGMDETQKQVLMNANACLIENIRTLLKLCRPISSV